MAKRKAPAKAAPKAKATPPPAKRPGGRPPEFDPDNHPRMACALCLLGATNPEIAVALGKSETTIDNWIARHPAFKKAVQEGRQHADMAVAQSFFRRATGFTYEAVKILQNAGQPVYAPYTERVHPDVTAGIFWLCNRRPDLWRHVQRHEHVGGRGGPVQIEDVSSDEARAGRVAEILERAKQRE